MICPQFLPEFPWSCFPDKMFQGVRGEKLQLEDLSIFFQTNNHLDEGFPYVFHRLFRPFREQQPGKYNSISVDNDFSP